MNERNAESDSGGIGLAEAIVQALEVDDLTIPELHQALAGSFDRFALAMVRPLLTTDQRFRPVRGGKWSLASRAPGLQPPRPPHVGHSRPAAPPRAVPRPLMASTPRYEAADDELTALEERLRQRLKGAQLIAEIGLDKALHDEICTEAKRARKLLYGDNARVAQAFPAIFSCHLVGHGVFDYAGGRYWSTPTSEGFDHQTCGSAFTTQLARMRLAGLREIDRLAAQKYVSRILIHGGIPQYCVHDFIALLDRSLGRYGSTANELMSAWAAMSSTFTNLDVPIERFLTLGGEFAVDYLDRCIDVLTDVVDADSAGLPSYLVEALLQDRDTAPAPGGTARLTARPRPYVELDPWDFDGPVLVLPAVTSAWAHASWVVTDSDGTRRSPVSLSNDRTVSIGPSNRWEVGLRGASGEALGSTVIAGLADEDPPILLFDSATGRLLPAQRPLDADDVLVLHPEGAVTGRQEFMGFGGSWSGYTASVVDLEGLTELTIQGRSWPVRRQMRPRLDGDPVQGIGGMGGESVFASPPRLWLPPEHAWTITVEVNGERTRFTATDLAPDGDGFVIIPVPAPVATVTLRVQGPLGSDLRQTFHVIAGLTLNHSDRVALPGEPPLAYTASAASGILLDGGVTARGTVEAGENVARPKLRVSDGRGTAVEVYIHLPVLSWQWVSGGTTGGSSAISSDRIIDGTLRGLRGSIGRPDIPVSLELHSPSGLAQEIPAQSRLASGVFSFPLGALADTLRALSDATLHLVLRVGARSFQLAALRPELLVEQLTVESTATTEQVTVHLEFRQNRNLNGRLVRFWPLYRPWELPVERELPDASATTVTFGFDPAELPPGQYRVQVGLADWSVPSLPTGSTSNSVDALVGGRNAMHERLGHIDPTIRRPGAIVLEHMLQTGTRREDLDEQQQIVISSLGPAGLVAMVQHLPLNHRGHAMLEVASVVGGDQWAALTALLDLVSTRDLSPMQRVGVQAALSAAIRPASQPPFGPETMEQLWRSLPVLATCVDGGARPHSLAQDRLIEHLGLTVPMGPRHQEIEAETPLVAAPAFDLVTPMKAISQQELAASAEQLNLLALHLGLRGRPRVFSMTGQQLAHFEWLAAGTSGAVDLEAFHRRWKPLLPIGVRHERLHAHQAARQPQRALPHAGLPGLSLVAAEAVTVRSHLADVCLEFLLALAEFAPLLVEHDLCLAALAVRQPATSPK